MLVLVAGLLLTLTGFAVLAIDVGRLFVVRNELQNVADAAALAGANCLTKTSVGGSANCSASTASTLNWDGALAKATDQIGKNSASNVLISSSDSGHRVEAGYWFVGQPNDSSPPGPSGGSFSKSYSPVGNYNKPAVKVTVTKATGMNNGPVFMLTRAMFGGAHIPMSASAVAVLSSPGRVAAGRLIPQAIDKCLYDLYWDYASGSPKLANKKKLTVTDARGNETDIPQTIGKPWVFRFGSAYRYPDCNAGQWTSFANVNPSSSYAKNLIKNNNPDPLSIGQMIFIQPGTMTNLYSELSDEYEDLPVNVVLPVVDAKLKKDGLTPIHGFAAFRMTDISTKGSRTYIEGSFTTGDTSSGSSGFGPFLGSYTPSRLAN